MKIRFKIIATLILGVASLSSCQEFLDVNHNPSRPEDSRLDLVFPAATVGTAAVIGGSFMSLGGIWAQHWTSDINQPGYMGEDSYSVQAGTFSYDIYGWGSLYAGALMDYEWVRKRAIEESDWDFYLAATVMQCHTYHVMVDLWDQIPVTEALQNIVPKYETGQEVYSILHARLDDALSKTVTNGVSRTLKDGDLVFEGNMAEWVAFANTLKLKMYIRTRFIRPTESLEGINKLYSDGVSFLTTDAKFSDFEDSEGNGNFWYEGNLRSSDGALRASNTFLMYLTENADPRLDGLFTKPEGKEHLGLWQGDYRDNFDSYDGSESRFSLPNIDPLNATYFISASESKFLQAEAVMMRGAAASDVETLYKEAVILNCSRYGVSASDAESKIFKSSYAKFPLTGTKTAQYFVIMMQKWVAMSNGQGLEAFFEQNRTDIPKLSAISPQDDNWDEDDYEPGEFTVSVQCVLPPPQRFPKRLLFPATERSKNPNTPASKNLNVPVWWEVENPSVE